MKVFLILILLFSTSLLANTFEVEALHLKNGDVVTVDDSSISTDQIKAVQLIDENQVHYLVTPKQLNHLLRNGGDGGGGAPMSLMSISRGGGDGSGGG